MPLPNFFVVGASKSGTTALWKALSQHPDVFMSPVKEPRFFSGNGSSHEYLSLFAAANGQRAIGESSGDYLPSAEAARRIRRNIPDAKLIALLRQPVERAHSHYWYRVRRGDERARSFEHALAREETLGVGAPPWQYYRRRGFYHSQLSAYLALFPREQLSIHLYEDWCDSPHRTLRELFTFLGVDPGVVPTLAKHNVGTAPRSRALHRLVRRAGSPALSRWEAKYNRGPVPRLSPATATMLVDGYRDDIVKLQSLIGRDLTHWLR